MSNYNPADQSITQAEVDCFRYELSFKACGHFTDQDIYEFLDGGCSAEDAETEYKESQSEVIEVCHSNVMEMAA